MQQGYGLALTLGVLGVIRHLSGGQLPRADRGQVPSETTSGVVTGEWL